MLVALGQYQRRPSFVNGRTHVVADKLIAGLIRNQLGVQLLELDSHILGRRSQWPKPGGTDMHGVRKWTGSRRCPGIDPVTNRPALHEDDRMLAILAADGRGQACDIPGLRPADDLLEALSGQVVAFVNNEMSIVSNDVIHDVLSYQALDDRHIQQSGRLPASTPDPTDELGMKSEKARQSLRPLFQQLLAMHQNKRIDRA